MGWGHMTFSGERLADLLVDPREDLDCEAKNWLDDPALNIGLFFPPRKNPGQFR